MGLGHRWLKARHPCRRDRHGNAGKRASERASQLGRNRENGGDDGYEECPILAVLFQPSGLESYFEAWLSNCRTGSYFDPISK